MNGVDQDAIHDAVALGDVSAAWLGWSSVETALADAFETGGFVLDTGLRAC